MPLSRLVGLVDMRELLRTLTRVATEPGMTSASAERARSEAREAGKRIHVSGQRDAGVGAATQGYAFMTRPSNRWSQLLYGNARVK